MCTSSSPPPELLLIISQYFTDGITWKNFSCISPVTYQIYANQLVTIFNNQTSLLRLLDYVKGRKYSYNVVVNCDMVCNGCNYIRSEYSFNKEHNNCCEHSDYCDYCLQECRHRGCHYKGCRKCMGYCYTNYDIDKRYCKQHFKTNFAKCSADDCDNIVKIIGNYRYYNVCRCGLVMCFNHSDSHSESHQWCDNCEKFVWLYNHKCKY